MTKSFFNSLIKSCVDFKFYREIYRQARGKTLRYLLFLALVVTVLLGIRYGIGLNKFLNQGVDWIEQNAPVIEIKDGEVSADVEQPFMIGDEDNEFIMIIDTTGKETAIPAEYKAGILLGKNKVTIKQDEVRYQTFDLAKIKNFRLDQKTLKKWRVLFIFVVIPLMIIMQFIYFYIAKIIQGALAALIIMIFKPGNKFQNIMNVTIYALTPATVVALIVNLINPLVTPFFWVVYMGMYVAFIVGGLKQCLSGSGPDTTPTAEPGV